MSQNPNESEMWSACWKDWNKGTHLKASVSVRTHQPEHLQGRPGNNFSINRSKSMVIRKDPNAGTMNKVHAATSKTGRCSIELTRRSFVNLVRNPVVLALRVAIYGGMVSRQRNLTLFLK